VERNKTAAKTAAYMAIYKNLFNAGKEDAFQFIEIHPIHRPTVSSFQKCKHTNPVS